jgi:hypothetical protein
MAPIESLLIKRRKRTSGLDRSSPSAVMRRNIE